jgi:NAD(P)-dependent dehydrogenase (short-subunit alcohol dehydrogenase family)
MSEPVSLQDRVVIVTGAGGGLGRAHALLFARHGAKVVVNDLGQPMAKAPTPRRPTGWWREPRRRGTPVANHDSVTDGARIVEQALDASAGSMCW